MTLKKQYNKKAKKKGATPVAAINDCTNAFGLFLGWIMGFTEFLRGPPMCRLLRQRGEASHRETGPTAASRTRTTEPGPAH